MPRHLAPCLLAVLLLAAGPASAEPPTHAVPEVRPIQLDGTPVPAEWSDALALELVPGTSLRLQQYRGTLMLALDSDRTWPAGSVLTLFLCPNGPQAGGRGPGCLRIDYEPFQHNRSHVIAYRYDAAGVAAPLQRGVVARQAIGPAGARVELAFPLKLLSLTTENRFPVRLCVQWARSGAGALYYPPGLDFRGGPGKPPVDFVSAGRWAILEGFGDPAGAGAFPAAQWKAWEDHDLELASRGAAAHHRVSLLKEEWRKEEKRDDEMLEEIVGNLQWVREHEPLTPTDVLAMATLWRYLGRHDHARGALGTLIDTSHRPAEVMAALHERALTNRASERYDDEASDWERLAALAGAVGGRYEVEAERARAQKTLWETEQERRRAIEADAANPRVRIETARGDIHVVLHASKVPEAVKHFLALVEKGFYDDTRFHRVKGDFMAQGGDPKTRPGGSGTAPEIPMETNAEHDYFRGALAFARPPTKQVNGGQFFIMTSPKPGLGEYTIFGHVVSGMAAVDRLELYDELVRAVRTTK